MSLELALQENTRAINALIAILRDQASTPAPEETAGATEPDPPEKLSASMQVRPAKRTKKEAAPATAGEPASEPSAPAPEPGAADASATEAAAAPAVEPPTYEQAAAAVTALIKTSGRDAAVALLKRFGASNLKGVDPAQYAELILAANDEAVPF